MFGSCVPCAQVSYSLNRLILHANFPVILNSRNLPLTEPIDLLNVAFENPRVLKASAAAGTSHKKSTPAESERESPNTGKRGTYDVPDRLTGLEQLEELRGVCPERTWNFVGKSCGRVATT